MKVIAEILGLLAGAPLLGFSAAGIAAEILR